MKKHILMGIAAIPIYLNAIGQITMQHKRPSKEMIIAKNYENGNVDKPYDPAKAISLYEQLITKGDEMAMYAAANMYDLGKGITKNPQRALELFEKAGNLGMPAAIIKAADMYDEGIGCKQDFTKARKLYKEAAMAGLNRGSYCLAMYNYKGLGGEQNYTTAYNEFSKLANAAYTNAYYYTGLCLRNGYGVERNIVSAKSWLMRGMEKGDKLCIEEARAATAENPNKAIALPVNYTTYQTLKTTSDYRRIKHNVRQTDLPGTYKGYAIRYDWSGQHVIDYWPIELELKATGSNITGVYKDEQASMDVNATLGDDGLTFANTAYKKADHYFVEPTVKEFRNAKMQVVQLKDSTYLVGAVDMFIPARNEPEKPMKLYLRAVNKIQPLVVNDVKMNIFPNPVENSLQLQFTLNDISKATLVVMDMQGKILLTENAGNLLPGTYQRNLNISNLAAGTYQAKVTTTHGTTIGKFIKQ